MVQIANVRLEPAEGGQRLSGELDGKPLWWLFPAGIAVDRRAEPFLGVALLRAMSRHEDIVVDPAAPVSEDYRKSFEAVQRAFKQWNPGFRIAKIDASLADGTRHDGVLCSFSSGVDSLHSFIEHADEITHLLTLGGVDYVTGPRTDFVEVHAKTTDFATQTGKVPVVVDTNVREVCDAYGIRWNYAHGAILCSLAVSLGFRRYIIPGTYNYRDLKPWGSHPLIDPLWSTRSTEVVHDAIDALRTDKTANIARHPAMLRHLQVCKHSQVRNCGDCPKCVRTALTLYVLGIGESPVPCPDPVKHIPGFVMNHDLHAAFLWDVMQMAREHGVTEVEEACRKRIRRYKLERSARGFMKNLLGDRLADRLRKRTWDERSILLRDPNEFD